MAIVQSGRRPALAASYRSMADPLVSQASQVPERLALACEGTELTYAQLNAQVNRLARALRGQGVQAGDKVAYLLENRVELVTLYYAIQKLGAIAVPLNIRSIAREIVRLTGASDADVLVYSRLRADRIAEARPRLGHVRRLLCVDPVPDGSACLGELASSQPADEVDGPRDPDAVSRIQFTGGSTGLPKGAMRTHRADLVNVEGTYLSNFLPDDPTKVVLIQCPLEHHGGHAWLTMAIALGASVVICATFDPEEVCRAIERYRVSYMILLPPTTYLRLMQDPAIEAHDLSSVRLVQTSAGAASPEFVRAAYERFPNCRVNYGWGQTESGLGSSLVLGRDLVLRGDPKLGSIGTPMPFVELRLVDESGRDVRVGQLGECLLKSEAVMAGYYRQPGLTAEALPGDGWLRTGDMMVQDADGYYYLKYRKKDVVKSGGENVFATEVENVIRTHPDVHDCAVYGVADDRLGEAVAAAVSLRADTELDLAAVQEWCRTSLASYKKPLHLRVVRHLCRDFSGKVDKRRLARVHEAVLSAAGRSTPTTAECPWTQVSTDPDIIRIDVPAPDTGTRSTASYLLRSDGQALLIDTGPDSDLAEATLRRALDDSGVQPGDLDVVLTHEHPDHVGLLRRLAPQVRSVRAGRECLASLGRLATPGYARAMAERFAAEGFTAQLVDLVRGLYHGSAAVIPTDVLGRWTALMDGQELRVGSVDLRVLATPGHAVGHVCFIDDETGTVFSGDHLLFSVSPPVMVTPDAADPFADYFTSLDRLEAASAVRCFPGHGRVDAGGSPARIHVLRSHHRARLDAIAALAAAGPVRAPEVASRLDWTINADSWEAAPPALRVIIAGQTLAYLDHLVAAGVLARHAGSAGSTYTTTRE